MQFLFIIFLFFPWIFNGVDVIWAGGGGSGSPLWSDTANWGGFTPMTGDRLIFPNSTMNPDFNNLSTYDSGGILLSNVDFDISAPLNGGSSTYFINNDSAALSLNNNTITFNNGGSVVNFYLPLDVTGTLNFTTIGTGGEFDIGGTISGTGSVTYTDNVYRIIDNCSYAGGATVSAGTAIYLNGFTNAPFGTGSVNMGSAATLETSIFSITIANDFTLASNTFTIVGNTVSLTLSGVISGSDFTVANGGMDTALVLSNTSNNYTGTVTINSGASLQGPPDAIKGDLDNGGRVVFTDGTGTFSGDITNTGSVTKQGTGTCTLTGTNTYSGGTIVSNGTLQGNTVSLQGDIQNDSALVFDLASNGTFSGDITGTGSVTKQGAAICTLTGTNSYSGGTIVSAGTLQGNTTSLQGDIQNDSALVFDLASNGTFSGDITGTGSVTKQGAGTCTLTGTNDYSGGTIVSVGTLQGNTTSLQGDIQNDSALVFDLASNGTFSGLIHEAGTVNKIGAAVLTFNTNQTYTGATTVEAGVLSVNADLASSVIVQNNAILRGVGPINNDVSIQTGGLLAPGNSVGTIEVNGLVTFDAGGIFNVELTPTTTDLLLVTGGMGAGVDIDSNAILRLDPDPGIYTSPLELIVIDATATSGLISGQFGSVENSFPLFNPTLDYTTTPGILYLRLTITPISNLVTTGNAAKVAACINALADTATGDLANVIGDLFVVESAAELKDALNEMQPSQFTNLAMAQEDLTVELTSRLKNRSANLDTTCPREQRKGWTVWFDGVGNFSHQDALGEELGFGVSSGGALLGFECGNSNNSYLGFATAYSYSRLNWKEDWGHANLQSGYAFFYQNYFQPYFTVSSNLGAGYNYYDIERIIQFVNVDRVAESHHQGFQVNGNIALGIPLPMGSLTLTPYTSADFIYLFQPSFQETGAQSLDLSIQSVQSYYVREEAGLDFKICRLRETSRHIFQFGAAYVGEWRFGGDIYSASLRDTSCVFSVRGMNPQRNLIAPSGAWTAIFADEKASISLKYDGLYGSSYQQNTVSFMASYSF